MAEWGEGSIIVFDGECVLCSANARFVLRFDRQARFRLAAVQSPVGADICRRFGIDSDDPTTLIVLEGDRALTDSAAVFAIWRGLGWPWRIATMLAIVPRPVRDAAYRLVARNRYRLFGRRDRCWMPAPEYRHRLL